MPGSYRPISSLIKKYEPEKVKNEGVADERGPDSSSV